MKIKCSHCGEISKVSGVIWKHRLRHSEPDTAGNYTGWNCDRCSEAREMGGE